MNLLGRKRGKYCYNGGKQHNFKPRYDEVPASHTINSRRTTASEFRKLLYHNVYVKDVCTWCGKEVKK